MKKTNSTKLVRKAVTPELAEHRNAGEAGKLRHDLTEVKGLAGLSSEQIAALGARLRVRRFRKRALIYSGGQTGDTIYIMLSGIARMTSVNRKRERVLLEVLGPGDVICIPTLLPDVRHSLECDAFTDCEVGVLTAQALVETSGLEYGKFLIALKLTMGRWWALLVRQSRFVDQTLEERVAVALLDLAGKFGLTEARGTIINVRFGHRDLADLVSGSRPKVSVCLKQFAMRGALVQDGRRVIIVPEKLSEILGRSLE